MEQLKPPPHPLMALSVDTAEAQAFFEDPSKIETIRNSLTKRLAPLDIAKVDAALREISIVCYRYVEARRYHFPDDNIDKVWLKRLGSAAIKFGDLIDECNVSTFNGLLIALGEEAQYRHGRPTPNKADETDEDRDQRLSRQYERGLAVLNVQIKLLHWLQSATEAAHVRPFKKKGPPPVDTPYLERSLLHELVDIWCRHHDENFAAPKERICSNFGNVRPNQMAAQFIETVIEQAGFDFSSFNMVRLGELVRDERVAEWTKSQEDPNYAATRASREDRNRIAKTSLRRRRSLGGF